MKLQLILLFFLATFLSSCSKYLLNLENKDIYEVKSLEGKELSLQLKKIYVPYTFDYDVGVPAHFESIWITNEEINEIFDNDKITKRRFLRKLNSWNDKTEAESKILRLPTKNEIDKFNYLDAKPLTKEKLEQLKNRDVINDNIYLVRTFKAMSDTTSMPEITKN